MLSKVLSLDQLSCPQIWNIEKEKDREKEKIGDRPAKLNEKKRNGELEREIRSHFLLEEQHEFVAVVRKWEMLVATRKILAAGKKKVSKNMYDISSIKVMLHRTISNDDF